MGTAQGAHAHVVDFCVCSSAVGKAAAVECHCQRNDSQSLQRRACGGILWSSHVFDAELGCEYSLRLYCQSIYYAIAVMHDLCIWLAVPQVDFRNTLKSPVALREFGRTSHRRSTLKQPISRINILDASMVEFSRSERVRRAVPSGAQKALAVEVQ